VFCLPQISLADGARTFTRNEWIIASKLFAELREKFLGFLCFVGSCLVE
jgi:hypothetical protein